MPITNTDEFLAYSSFNSAGGVTTSDTFNTWRKKTNGIINTIDNINVSIANINITNILAEQLSLGSPTWTSAGALTTYLNGTTRGSFTAGAIVGTSLNVGTGAITAGSFNTVGTITYGTLNGAVVTAQTINSTNTITAASAIRSNGTLTGNSLAIQTGTNPVTASISNAGLITGSSLTVGTGAVSCGPITGSSLNVGIGAVSAGSLAVGANNTQFTVTAGGVVNAAGDIIAFSTSDRKFKDNIINITTPLDKVSRINGVTFDWNDKQSTFSGSDIGVIAQEVEAVLPQIVITREDGSKAVKYDKVVALLIECVKELKAEIDTLKLLIK